MKETYARSKLARRAVVNIDQWKAYAKSSRSTVRNDVHDVFGLSLL